MSLEQKVNDAIKTAMKERNEPELRGLRAIKSAILLIKTSENPKDELTEAEETKLLQKLVKQRKDSLEIYRQQKREDLAKKEEEEIAVIERFLPKQMDENDIKIALTGIIEEAGASSPADMGRVMGLAMKKLSGKADGKTISRIVKALLAED
jgi:uncharacterized protein YqeY